MQPASRDLLEQVGGSSHDDGHCQEIGGSDLLDGCQGLVELFD